MQNKYPQFDNNFAQQNLLLGMFVYEATGDKAKGPVPTTAPGTEKVEAKNPEVKKEPTQVELEHEVGALQKLLSGTDKALKENKIANKDILIGKYKEFQIGDKKQTLEKTIEDDDRLSDTDKTNLLAIKKENREALLSDVRKAWVEVSTLKTVVEMEDKVEGKEKEGKRTRALRERLQGRTEEKRETSKDNDWSEYRARIAMFLGVDKNTGEMKDSDKQEYAEIESMLGKETMKQYIEALNTNDLAIIPGENRPGSVRELCEQLAALRNQVDQRLEWEALGENIDKEDPNKFLEGLKTSELTGTIDETNFDQKLSLYFDQFQKYTTAVSRIQEAMSRAESIKAGCVKARSKLGVFESGKTHRAVLVKLQTFITNAGTAITHLDTQHTSNLRESGKALSNFQRKRMGAHQENLKQLILRKEGALQAFDSQATEAEKSNQYKALLQEIRENAEQAIGKEIAQRTEEKNALEKEKSVQKQELHEQKAKREAELKKEQSQRQNTKTQLETRKKALEAQIKKSSGDEKTKQERQLNAVNDLLDKISTIGKNITEKDIDTIFANQEAVIIQYFDEKIDALDGEIQELTGKQEQIGEEIKKTEAQVQEMLAISNKKQRDVFEAACDTQIDQYRTAYVNDAMQVENLESMVKGYDFKQTITNLREAGKGLEIKENENRSTNLLQQFGNSAAQSVEIMLPKDAGGLQKALLILPATMIEYLGEISKGIGDLASDKDMRDALWDQITTNPGGFGKTLLKGLIRYDQYAESKDVFDVIRTGLKSVIDILLTATGVGAIKHGFGAGRAVATGAIRGGANIGGKLARAMSLGARGTKALAITGGTLAGFVGVPAGIVAVPTVAALNFSLNLPANILKATGGLTKSLFSIFGVTKAFNKGLRQLKNFKEIEKVMARPARVMKVIEKGGGKIPGIAKFLQANFDLGHNLAMYKRLIWNQGALKAIATKEFWKALPVEAVRNLRNFIGASLRMGFSPLGLTQAVDIMRLSTGAGFFKRVVLGAKEFGTTNMAVGIFTKFRNFGRSMGTLKRTWSPRAALAYARKMRAEKTIAKLKAIQKAQVERGTIHPIQTAAVINARKAIDLRILELEAVVKSADTVIDTATNFVKIQQATMSRIQGIVGKEANVDELATAMDDFGKDPNKTTAITKTAEGKYTVTVKGKPVELTQKQFDDLARELRAYAENSAKIKALNAPSQAAKEVAEKIGEKSDEIAKAEKELAMQQDELGKLGAQQETLTKTAEGQAQALKSQLDEAVKGIKNKATEVSGKVDTELASTMKALDDAKNPKAGELRTQMDALKKSETETLAKLDDAMSKSDTAAIKKIAEDLDEIMSKKVALYKEMLAAQKSTVSSAIETGTKNVSEAAQKIKDRIQQTSAEVQTKIETTLKTLEENNHPDAPRLTKTLKENITKQQKLTQRLDEAIATANTDEIKKVTESLDDIIRENKQLYAEITKIRGDIKAFTEVKSATTNLGTAVKKTAGEIKAHAEKARSALDAEFTGTLQAVDGNDALKSFKSQLDKINAMEQAQLKALETATNIDDVRGLTTRLDETIAKRTQLYQEILRTRKESVSGALKESVAKVKETGEKIGKRVTRTSAELETRLDEALVTVTKGNHPQATIFQEQILTSNIDQATALKKLEKAIAESNVEDIKKATAELDNILQAKSALYKEMIAAQRETTGTALAEAGKRVRATGEKIKTRIAETSGPLQKDLDNTLQSLGSSNTETALRLGKKNRIIKDGETRAIERLDKAIAMSDIDQIKNITKELDNIMQDKLDLRRTVLAAAKQETEAALKNYVQKTFKGLKPEDLDDVIKIIRQKSSGHFKLSQKGKRSDIIWQSKDRTSTRTLRATKDGHLQYTDTAGNTVEIGKMEEFKSTFFSYQERIKNLEKAGVQPSQHTSVLEGLSAEIKALDKEAPAIANLHKELDELGNIRTTTPEALTGELQALDPEAATIAELQEKITNLERTTTPTYKKAFEQFDGAISQHLAEQTRITGLNNEAIALKNTTAETHPSTLGTLPDEVKGWDEAGTIQKLKDELAQLEKTEREISSPAKIGDTLNDPLLAYQKQQTEIQKIQEAIKTTKEKITAQQEAIKKAGEPLKKAQEALAAQKAALAEVVTPVPIKGAEFGDEFLRVWDELSTNKSAHFENRILKQDITIDGVLIKASEEGGKTIGLSGTPTLEDIAAFQVEFARYKSALKTSAPGMKFEAAEIAEIIAKKRIAGEFAIPSPSLREATRRSAVRTVESAKKGLISARDFVVEQAKNFLTQKNPIVIRIDMALGFIKRAARGTMETISPQWLVEFFSHNAALRSIRQGPLDEVAKEAGVTKEAAQLALNNAKNQFESMFETLSRTLTPAKSPGRNIGRGSITAEVMNYWKNGKTLTLPEATALYMTYVAATRGDKERMDALANTGRELVEKDKQIDAQISKLETLRETNKEAFDLYTEVMQSEDRNLGGRGRFETTTTKIEQRSFWEKIISFFQTLASGKIMEAFKEFSKGKEVTKNFSEAELKRRYGTSINIINNTNEMIQDTKENCDLARVVPAEEGADASDPLIMFLDVNDTDPKKSRVFSINRKGYTVDCKEKDGAKNNRMLTIEGADYELTKTENGKILAKKDGVEKPLVEYLNMAEAGKRGGLYIDTYNSGQSILWSKDGNQQVLGKPFQGKELKNTKEEGTAPGNYFSTSVDGKQYQIKYINGLFHYRTNDTAPFMQIPLPGKEVEEPKAPEVAAKPEEKKPETPAQTGSKPAEEKKAA